MTEKERMEAGLIYDPADEAIVEEQTKCLDLLYEFNQTRPTELKRREAMLKEMFGAMGEGCYIEPPFHANWGGRHCYFGNYVYANFNLTLVDDGNIYVGDRVMFGPNVVLATPNHPINAKLRSYSLQYNKEIHIGNNVWIGANVVVVPGVTIGDNSVIGAGSVVTKDIPSNVVAVGNPCHILREIGEQDHRYFYKKEEIDWENLSQWT